MLPVIVYAYNVAPLALTSLRLSVRGGEVASELPPLDPGGSPTCVQFELDADDILSVTYPDQPAWTANISVSLLPPGDTAVLLWFAMNGVFMTTSDGKVRQYHAFAAVVNRLRSAMSRGLSFFKR